MYINCLENTFCESGRSEVRYRLYYTILQYTTIKIILSGRYVGFGLRILGETKTKRTTRRNIYLT